MPANSGSSPGLRTTDAAIDEGAIPVDGESVPRVSRRTLATGVAWATPTLLLAVAAPAAAASGSCVATIATTGLAGDGRDLNLREGKTGDSATNTSPTGTLVVNLRFLVTCGGLPAPEGTTVTVVGDNATDGDGNFMIGFTPTTASAFNESDQKRIATVLTDSAGYARVKVCTATYSLASCLGGIPRLGTTFDVVVEGNVTTFTYLVYDAGTLVTCP